MLMLKMIRIAFIRAAGWPEEYTVCSGNLKIDHLKRDIREMQELVVNREGTAEQGQENTPKKIPLSLVKKVISA